MIGKIESATWITLAADVDGVAQPEKVGTRTHQLRAYFAYKAEAEAWLAEQQANGYEGAIGMAAISYFGPTDSPSNAWFVQAEREITLELVWCELVNAPAHYGKHQLMPNCRHPHFTGTHQTFAEHTAAMIAATAGR